MRPATLCVVDMQPYFEAVGRKGLIDKVCFLIRGAKRAKAGIVLLEFEDCGSTHLEVLEEVGSYGKCVTAHKKDCDGGKEFVKACHKKGFNTNKIIVCGVETDNCVLATIEGLNRLLPKSKIEVYAPACNVWGDSDIENEMAFDRIRERPNVKVRRK